ncbi:MAG: 4'-phosphopantetheinyl transferase superfamily protein [Herbiconiux sp.]|nr:4'-phosphopantetheinyl transferase superfamily protein [Herbiconiux sp.]
MPADPLHPLPPADATGALPGARPLGVGGALWMLVSDPSDRGAGYRALAVLAASTLALTTPDQDPTSGTGAPGAAARALSIRQHCPVCGGDDHGRPEAVDADGAFAAHVSLSRAGAHLALAASARTPIGIDVESIAAVRAAPLDAAFDPPELAAFARTEAEAPADAARRRAEAWAAKEAVLKAAGTGLRIDPQSLGLDWPAGHAHPVLARSSDPRIRPAAVTLLPLPGLPADLVGFAALLA